CLFPAGAAPDLGSAPAAAATLPPRVLGPPPLGPLSPISQAEGRRPGAEAYLEECSVTADAILAPLREALDSCRPVVQKQVCDDIGRRLTVLGDAWAQEKLSAPVRKRMCLLVQELQHQHWDTADEIHRSLMVDHVNEVSQWLVGIKRLIAEMRSLLAVEPVAVTDSSAEAGPGQEDP
ncbi:SRA1 protein, partial [Chordeiles acutipennis]|nr:SRA1 protein [Chordeiles acutipennis]